MHGSGGRVLCLCLYAVLYQRKPKLILDTCNYNRIVQVLENTCNELYICSLIRCDRVPALNRFFAREHRLVL